ncbi:MAG: GNAT family N-acetyltransferase [Actinomycetales bacterium]|nr:GNAT family N-acetyltransferase [Actinomycetales bacterium]
MHLTSGAVGLRPLRLRDRKAWDRLRRENIEWLRRWEATAPEPNAYRPTFAQYVREQNQASRRGLAYSFVVEHEGEMVGQLTISGITRGSLQSASIGYWISEHAAGRGIVPSAVAMASDFCWFEIGLHRVEINIRPENAASLRVVEKLGFRDEGFRERFLHIQGAWCDHRSFALTLEDVPEGLVSRLTDSRRRNGPTRRRG